jgi:hypothetical protein
VWPSLSTSATGCLGFPRLASYFPATLLDNAFAVPANTMPFPPVREYGLLEFETMANMSMEGITFGNMYFVQPTQSVEELHFHELIHVIQWSKLGIEQFLLTYGLGILQFGYEHSPFEAIAYELQTRFKQAEELPNVVEYVERHAIANRDAAEAVFIQQGIQFGS